MQTAHSRADVSVVIVTFNSRNAIIGCLETLGVGVREIVVVDNDSRDSTCDLVESYAASHPLAHIRLIRNEQNIGYGRGANVGFDNAASQHALLINPDIRITSEQIHALVARADEAPVVAPNVITTDGHCEQPHLSNAELVDGVAEVPWVVGAAMLFDLERAPRFDENIFLFFEETDLCRRLDRLVIVPDVEAIHETGSSSGPNLGVVYLKGWHCAWSRHYYRRKHKLKHSIPLYLLKKCMQYGVCIGSPRKRAKYGSRIAGTLAWLKGLPADSMIAIPPRYLKNTPATPPPAAPSQSRKAA